MQPKNENKIKSHTHTKKAKSQVPETQRHWQRGKKAQMKGPQSPGWGLAGDDDHGPTIAHPLAWLPSSPQTLNLTLKPGPHAATPSPAGPFLAHWPLPEA